jgi:hypothetical protein
LLHERDSVTVDIDLMRIMRAVESIICPEPVLQDIVELTRGGYCNPTRASGFLSHIVLLCQYYDRPDNITPTTHSPLCDVKPEARRQSAMLICDVISRLGAIMRFGGSRGSARSAKLGREEGNVCVGQDTVHWVRVGRCLVAVRGPCD